MTLTQSAGTEDTPLPHVLGSRLTQSRIFRLSQDKDQIFVTFPTWTKAYGKDKGNTTDKVDINELTKDDFLWMEEYGPFRLDSADDVAQIANFLHGYTVHASGILDQSGK